MKKSAFSSGKKSRKTKNDVLEVHAPEQTERRDAAVRAFREQDVCRLSEYAKAVRVRCDGEPLLFLAPKTAQHAASMS